MAIVAGKRWGAVGGDEGSLLTYEPGVAEFTNLGLLYTRCYITYNGITGILNVDPDVEKTKFTGDAVDTAEVSDLAIYAGKPFILLPCLNKTLPGVNDAPTWTLSTDSDKERIGRTYVGKPESLTQLEFTCPASMKLQKLLTAHSAHGSGFSILQCYDDPNQSKLYYVLSPRCSIMGVGTSSQENNSGGEYQVRFQPVGGMFEPVYIEENRATESNSNQQGE